MKAAKRDPYPDRDVRIRAGSPGGEELSFFFSTGSSPLLFCLFTKNLLLRKIFFREGLSIFFHWSNSPTCKLLRKNKKAKGFAKLCRPTSHFVLVPRLENQNFARGGGSEFRLRHVILFRTILCSLPPCCPPRSGGKYPSTARGKGGSVADKHSNNVPPFPTLPPRGTRGGRQE